MGAYSHYQTNRHLHFASINRYAKASHNSWEGLVGIEAGLNIWSHMTPFVRVDFIGLSQQGFTENGADSLNLNVDRHTDQVVQSELGMIWTRQYRYKNYKVLPRVKLSYINDAPCSNPNWESSFVDSTCRFAVEGLRFSRNLGAASLGLTYLNYNDTIGVNLRYDGQFGENYLNQSANIAVDVKF